MRSQSLPSLLRRAGVVSVLASLLAAAGCGSTDTTATAYLTWQIVDASYPDPQTAPALTCQQKGVTTVRVQLTDERAALGDYLVPGEEVATFRGPAELVDKVAYYLARPDERRRIAERAHLRAHRDHTFERRLRSLLQTVGLPITG